MQYFFDIVASVDDLLFDDEIRIVSEEGEEIDEGRVIASPVPEGFEGFEDLGEDLEELPEDKEVKKEKDSGRIIPIVLEEGNEQVVPKKGRAKGEEESSPLPARKKAKADLLEELQLQHPAESSSTFFSTEQEDQVGEFTNQEATTVTSSSSVVKKTSKTVTQTTFSSSTARGEVVVEEAAAKVEEESTLVGKAHEASTRQVEILSRNKEEADSQVVEEGFLSCVASSAVSSEVKEIISVEQLEQKSSVVESAQFSSSSSTLVREKGELQQKVRENPCVQMVNFWSLF